MTILILKYNDATGRILAGTSDGATALTEQYINLRQVSAFGSTNTFVTRWTTVVTDVGTDLTFTQSATLGDLITVNQDGLYMITLTGASASGGSRIAIVLNSTIELFSSNSNLANAAINFSNRSVSCSWIGKLVNTNVIRFNVSNASVGNLDHWRASMAKISDF